MDPGNCTILATPLGNAYLWIFQLVSQLHWYILSKSINRNTSISYKLNLLPNSTTLLLVLYRFRITNVRARSNFPMYFRNGQNCVHSLLQTSSFYQGHRSIMIQVVHEGVVSVDPLFDGRTGVGLVVREEDHAPFGN